MRWTKEQFAEWCRKKDRQNPDFDPKTYKGTLVGYDLRLAAQGGKPVPSRPVIIRQTLNKTEERYWKILKADPMLSFVSHHTIKLQLAEKCWYTPDFNFVDARGLVFVETKGGFERDDAIVKLKTAARLFPQFTFIKAKYVKGQWTETVMPK